MLSAPQADGPEDPVLLPPGVYAPQEDTRLLARALSREPVRPGDEVLDLGTGGGSLALAAARRGARVTAVDRAWRAVLTARVNACRAGLSVEVLHGDLVDPVRGRRFDLILSNPPYVPAPNSALPRFGAALAWDAGRDGRAVVDRVCAEAAALLRPGGVLLLVHSALCGVQQTLSRLTGTGLRARVAYRDRVPFGPVLASRRQWLEEQGLIAPGDDEEELAVFRAEAALPDGAGRSSRRGPAAGAVPGRPGRRIATGRSAEGASPHSS